MDTPERRIAAFAGIRDNVITREQLRQCGFTDRQIAWRVRNGSLQRQHPSVFIAGFAPPTLRARVRAALLSCGPDAAGSHLAVPALWGIVPEPELIDVTVPGRNPGTKRGVKVHRVRSLSELDVHVRDGLRLTTPARAVLDLAATRPRRELEHVIQEAVVRRFLDDRVLEQALARDPRRAGSAAVRAILDLEGSGEGFTRSYAERALLNIVLAADLPRPRKNVFVEGELVDAVWDAKRVVVEIDGASTHAHRLAFTRDRRRDSKLAAAGWRVLRFTYRQLLDEPLVVAVRLAQALAGGDRHGAL